MSSESVPEAASTTAVCGGRAKCAASAWRTEAASWLTAAWAEAAKLAAIIRRRAASAPSQPRSEEDEAVDEAKVTAQGRGR